MTTYNRATVESLIQGFQGKDPRLYSILIQVSRSLTELDKSKSTIADVLSRQLSTEQFRVLLTAEERASDTTLSDVPDLIVDLEENAQYIFEAQLFFLLDATGGVKISLDGSALMSDIRFSLTAIRPGTGLYDASMWTGMGSVFMNSATPTDLYATISGSCFVRSAGNLKFKFAQKVATGSSYLLNRSFLKVKRV